MVTLTPASFRVCPFQVGALDGVVFGMKKPPFKDRRGNIVNQNAYFIHRKDKFGLLCVAICDYKRRFTWWDMSHVGNMHDWMAWAATPLGSAINEGALPHPYFINADSAFSVGPNMLVPFWCARHGSTRIIHELRREFLFELLREFSHQYHMLPVACVEQLLVRFDIRGQTRILRLILGQLFGML